MKGMGLLFESPKYCTHLQEWEPPRPKPYTFIIIQFFYRKYTKFHRSMKYPLPISPNHIQGLKNEHKFFKMGTVFGRFKKNALSLIKSHES